MTEAETQDLLETKPQGCKQKDDNQSEGRDTRDWRQCKSYNEEKRETMNMGLHRETETYFLFVWLFAVYKGSIEDVAFKWDVLGSTIGITGIVLRFWSVFSLNHT